MADIIANIEAEANISAGIEAEANISGDIEITLTPVGTVVRDVKVDGTSVVANEVAEIDLTGKQDSLPSAVNGYYLHANASTGALEWAEVQGGDTEVFWVTFTTTRDVWSCDKTMEEIRTAYNAGKTVVAKHLDKRYLISYISTIRISFSEVVSPVSLYQVELINYRSSGITSTSYGYRAVEDPNESEILNGNGVYIYNWDDDDSAWQNIDTAPTEDSTNLIESGGVYTALSGKQNAFTVGENLKLINGVLSVDTADVVEQDNTKPVTSAAVHVEIGNIEALLAAL